MEKTVTKNLKWFLVFLFFSLFINVGMLTLLHEEPRRGIVTFEMLKNHNFLEPTVLGEPYYKKPPLHNWTLAVSSLITGSVSEVSLRTPSIVFVILTVLLIYTVGARLINKEVAFLASLIYPTFFIVLFGYASKCEPDTLFTLFVTASILLWLLFFEKGRELLAWTLGYFFTSLAALTKGLPAFQFFYFFILSYAIAKKEWRMLLTKYHLAGGFIGLLPFTGWIFSVSTQAALKTLVGEVLSRSPGNFSIVTTLKKYLSFPIRFITATFPWSAVLIYLFLKRKLSTEPIRSNFYLKTGLIFVGLSFLLYWVFPGSRLRYLMPALPILSIIVAVLLKDFTILHKRAKGILQFTMEIIVPVGIVVGIIYTHNPSFILKETLLFLLFGYLFYFFFLPRVNFTRLVVLISLLMLLARGFYSSYGISIAELNYPNYRETAREIANCTKSYPLYTKTKYLQLCFYVEIYRDKVLTFKEEPPKESLFLSEKLEGNVLKDFHLGKHNFYLCSYSLKALKIPGRTSDAEVRNTKSQ